MIYIKSIVNMTIAKINLIDLEFQRVIKYVIVKRQTRTK